MHIRAGCLRMLNPIRVYVISGIERIAKACLQIPFYCPAVGVGLGTAGTGQTIIGYLPLTGKFTPPVGLHQPLLDQVVIAPGEQLIHRIRLLTPANRNQVQHPRRCGGQAGRRMDMRIIYHQSSNLSLELIKHSLNGIELHHLRCLEPTILLLIPVKPKLIGLYAPGRAVVNVELGRLPVDNPLQRRQSMEMLPDTF